MRVVTYLTAFCACSTRLQVLCMRLNVTFSENKTPAMLSIARPVPVETVKPC